MADDEVMVQKYGAPVPSISGLRTNLDDDDDEAFCQSTGDSKHVSMAVRGKLDVVDPSELAEEIVAEIIADTGSDEQVHGFDVVATVTESGVALTMPEDDIVKVDIGAPADDRDLDDNSFMAKAMAQLQAVKSEFPVAEADVAVVERTGDGSSAAVADDDDSSNDVVIVPSIAVAQDQVKVAGDAVVVKAAEPVAPRIFTPELTANPLRDSSYNDAGIQRSGSIDLGVRISEGKQVIYSREQKPGCPYELSGFTVQFDHGNIKSALRVLFWFASLDDVKACFNGSRFTDPDGNSGIILTGAPVVCKDDIQVLTYVESGWRRP